MMVRITVVMIMALTNYGDSSGDDGSDNRSVVCNDDNSGYGQ